jgi:HK97 family phage prohead protease
MNQNIEFKAIPGQFNIDEAQGIVECFVAGIGNKDSVGDVLVSGAFTKSLTRRKPRVVWGHNWNDPIGKVIEIYEVAPGDRRLPMKMLSAGIGGLYARVQFNLNSEKGREAFANVAFFGQEQEWSIGYKTLDSIFDPNIQANILKEVELYEVSPVLHGANQLTGTISVKSDEQFDDAKGGMMVVGMGGPMAGKPTGMMPNRRPTPNILEANKPKIGDERKNQLEIELSLRAGAPVKVRVAEENSVIFDRLTPDGAPTTYKVSYHFTGKEFMFGKPEKVSVQTVYVPSSEESGSRVIIPSQMPSMPMQVKPQRDAYMGDSHDEYHSMMPKSYDDGEKWAFDDDIADLANIISDSLDIKVGRALSSKNMSKLKAILENLQDVIASAEKDVESKSDYVIPVAIENAFETKQLLDPIFDYHRVESHVTENGIIVTSGVTQEFVEALGVAEKALGRRLGGGLGKVRRAARGAANFDPKAWDGDGDGLVQEGTPYQRPAIPGVNDRSTGGRVDVSAATRAFRQDENPESSDSNKPSSRREGLASRGKPDPISREGEFHGGNIYDEFNGQYVEGEVIALSDLYGDDRPGYAVVGRYDSDGTGTVDYFYGGDDEEFETIEDAVAFLQNIENEGENDRFYNDDNFRSLDRARSAGRPGKRPLAGLASSSSASWQLPNSEKDKDGITVLDSQVLKDRTAGLSLDEAAKKFGIPKEKIRKMEAREMQRIREEMNPKDFVAYRMMGMSLEDLSKITGKTRAELRQIEAKEIARMKKNPSNEELLEYRERGMSLENLSKISGLKREEIRKREITAWNGKPQIPEPDKRMSDYDIRKMQEGMIDGLASTNPNVRPNAGVIKYSNDLLNEKLEDLDSDPQPGMAGAMLDRAWAEGVIEGLRDGRLSSEDAINIIGLAGSDVFNEGKKPEGQRDQGLIDSRIKLSKRLRKSVVDSMSEGDMEEYQANRRRRGGFASNRSEGTMLGRDGQISRDERGNVDPTEVREARAAFDQNVFKKLKELGFDDEEIEKLTGVPDGGRVGEGGKPAQYVPDNLGRGGLASESRAPGKLSNNTALQRINRATSESGTTVLDSQILKDFLSGMSAEEINSKHKLGGASNANSAANREIRRIRTNINSQANSDMDLLIYRTSGLSLRETAELFNISPKEVRKREIRLQLKLRKEIDDEDLLYLRSGLTLEQTGRALRLDPSDVRKKEQKIINNNRKKIKDTETAADKQRETDSSALEINEELSEMDAGPRYQEISKRLGISVDEVKESIGRAKDRKERTSRATEGRTGLSSESREMDMTLAEYAKIDEVLSKYMDDSQLSGIGADEDMQVIQNILDKIDDSSAANDAIVMSDSEIDEYIDTLTRMKNNGPVEDQSDKEEIEKLIDSLNKTKKSATGSYSSEALEDAGTRLSSPSGAASEGEKNRPVKKVRAFRTLNGTINPHKKLEIELTENEIGALREEVDLLSRTAENPNILRAVGEKLRKANKGKFSITSDEYEDIVKSIEQSKSKGGIPSSDILGVLEQASETSDGKFSSLNLRGGGLASSNGGKRPNNGAPPDITEAMQKELIFWGKSSRGYNLALVQEAIKEYDANDGQLPPAMWKRLQTMYKNMGPGSASGGARRGMTGRNNGSGRRARTGLASSGGEESMGRDRGPGVSVSGLGDVGMRADSQGSFGVGRGGADMSSGGGGTNQEKFEGVSFDDAKPGNWGELTNEEKFEWLMYEGNPEKVADKDQRMSRAAHEGAVKKVLTDMEREERRSMSPAERRAAKESERSETSERELERQRVAREKREKDKAQEKTPKEYKPAPNAEEGKKKRAVDFDSFKEWIEDTEIMLGDIDEGQDYDPIAQDIWKTVDALLGDKDMTKRSIDDTIDALEDYLEGASSDNKYEKKSISRAKKLLSELSKAKTKYENDPWIVDDRIRTGLASRSGGPNRPRPGSREMPQSNAKRDNEMKKIIDTAQRVIDEMKSQKDSNKGRRARVGLASSSRPKAMITDEATFFKDIETSLQKEIRAAQKAKNKKAENGLSKLQEVIRRNEASKTGSRRTNVGSIYLTDDEADLVLDGLMFALDNQIEIGGDKRIEWYTKLLEKVSQAAMSTFINKNV